VNTTKIAGALAVAFGLCWFFLPPAVEVLDRPRAVAEGPRPLIVFATEGGESDHELFAYFTGGFDDVLVVRFTLFLTDDGAAKNDGLSAAVTFFGPDGSQGVDCEDEPVPMVHWNDLGAGTRRAFDVDRVSTYAGAHPLGELQEEPSSSHFPQWRGTVGTVTRGNSGDDRKSVTLDCVVSAKWIWYESPQRKSALLPQLNYTGIGDTTDHQSRLTGEVSLGRDPDWILSESYPEGRPMALSVGQELSSNWIGRRGEQGNLGYLLHSDMLFVERGADQKDVRSLTVAGVVLGIAGSLLVSAGARCVDVVAACFAHGSSRTRQDD
jgi:hypothetical protein